MGFGFKILRCSKSSFLQAANVFWSHEGLPDRVEGTLYVLVNLHERAGTPLHGYSQRQTVHKASCVKFRMERMDPNETPCKEKIAQANI